MKIYRVLLIWFCILWTTSALSNEAVTVKYRGVRFDIYKVNSTSNTITFFWKSPKGEVFSTFGRLAQWLLQQGDTLVFAMNAGIFMEDLQPLGLYIEKGKKHRPLNERTGYGNFYLKPNGVFLISEGKPMILETSRFKAYKGAVSYATQSGPLLVINNRVHSKFRKKSKNRLVRNGVGVDKKGNVVFAISNQPVNFYTFALLFKDKLKCSNALYLDGAISEIYLPELGRANTYGEFGALIGVVK